VTSLSRLAGGQRLQQDLTHELAEGMRLGFVVEFFKGRRELGMRGEEIVQFFVEQSFVDSLR